jgi:hypothetical protein
MPNFDLDRKAMTWHQVVAACIDFAVHTIRDLLDRTSKVSRQPC